MFPCNGSQITGADSYLEVDNDAKHQDGGHQVHQVGHVLPIERLTKTADLIGSRRQEMEKRDDRALKLGAPPSVDGGGTERLPDDRLTDVGGDEERDS